jgi:hypothetical protein
MTCYDFETTIEVMSSDVWLRVRIVRRGSRWWAQMSDDVSGPWRHGQRCWAQILMTCQNYEGMDRGVGLRFWWRVRIMKAWIEVLGSDSDDVSGLWRHGSRCWAQILMTCQDYEGMDRGVGLRFWRVRIMKAWIEVLISHVWWRVKSMKPMIDVLRTSDVWWRVSA